MGGGSANISNSIRLLGQDVSFLESISVDMMGQNIFVGLLSYEIDPDFVNLSKLLKALAVVSLVEDGSASYSSKLDETIAQVGRVKLDQ